MRRAVPSFVSCVILVGLIAGPRLLRDGTPAWRWLLAVVQVVGLTAAMVWADDRFGYHPEDFSAAHARNVPPAKVR